MKNVYFGTPIDITDWVSDALTGAKRHHNDTNTTLILTLYDQKGTMQELPVKRSRDMELFQEWLRRYDRYNPRQGHHLDEGSALC